MMEFLIHDTPCAKAEHETFARELAVHDNALVAYKRAYPTCTAESARANAYRLARHPDVVRRVAELQRLRQAALRERTADLEAALAALVVADPVELLDEDGNLIPLRELPAELRQWLSVTVEITAGADGQPVRKIRASIPNKLDGLKFLAQLRGELVERHLHEHAQLPAPTRLDPEREAKLDRLLREIEGEVVDAEVVETAGGIEDLL